MKRHHKNTHRKKHHGGATKKHHGAPKKRFWGGLLKAGLGLLTDVAGQAAKKLIQKI